MVNRRQFVTGIATVGTVAIAGCGGSSDAEPESEEEDIDNRALAQNAADVIDDELGLDPVSEDDPGWEFGQDENEWFVEYFTSSDHRFDFQVAGGAYAGIVDDGFELDAVLMGNEDEIGEGGYIAEIDRTWAIEFMNDDITDEEYLDRIEDTMT